MTPSGFPASDAGRFESVLITWWPRKVGLTLPDQAKVQDLEPAQLTPETKRPPLGSFLVGAAVGAMLGAAITMAVMNAGGNTAAVAEPAAAVSSHHEEPVPVPEVKKPIVVEPPHPAPPPAPANPPATVGGTLVERATRGDQDALNQMEAREPEQRSSEETIAIAIGKGQARIKDVQELEKKLTVVARFGREPETVRRIKALAYDAQVGIPTLRMLANLKSGLGADLLFTVWNRSGTTDFTSELAHQLIYSKDVYARASDAMKVILDMRVVKQCDKILEVMDRVKVHADQRALLSLQPFYSHKGCGPANDTDCWPCLRSTKLLDEATLAARTRAPP